MKLIDKLADHYYLTTQDGDHTYSDAYRAGFEKARDLILEAIWKNEQHVYCDMFYAGEAMIKDLCDCEFISYEKHEGACGLD